MVNWNLYSRRVKIQGESFAEEQANLAVKSIVEDFQRVPSWRNALFNGSTYKEIHVTSTIKNYYKNVLMKPGEVINTGDIIEFDNMKWLCVEVDKTNVAYEKGLIYKCDFIMSVHKDNHIYEVPCAVESNVRLYSMNVERTDYIYQLSDDIILRLPDNDITSAIQINDIYKIGRWNYRVTNLSDIIEPGLLILKMRWSAEEQSFPSPPPSSDYVLLGDSEINYGFTKTYTAVKYNDDGTVDETAQFDFCIIGDVPDTAYTLQILNDRQVSIKCNQYVYNFTLRSIDKLDDTKFVDLSIRLASLF